MKLKSIFIGSSSLLLLLVGVIYIYQYAPLFNTYARSSSDTKSSPQIEGTPKQKITRLEVVSNGTQEQKVVLTQQVHSGSDVSSSMVVRSAYIDTRARNGRKHSVNTVVIFAEVSMEIRKHGLIEGCGADSINAKAFKISTLYFPWINQHYPKLTHEEVMIDCYDLELHENSTAFVRYRPLPNSKEAITDTIDITYPARRDDYKDKVVVCTNCFGKPPWLTLSLPFVKSGTGASLGRSISVDPASPRLHVILLV